MPKMKTNKSVAKRFRLTGKGRLRRRRANKSHILTKKTPKRKRRLAQPALVAKSDEGRIKRMLP
ncbi:MAG: 50S ribosomal protein L35, partial [Gemmatimonadetes bacterium]|nr:50S ribosomal protein L35 [Gemmatimonadota bacterium]NIT66495.1 50S ribosomal protein L35 [Gemmatimonadota bacterium]NIU52643.1 50S ribosomal protein L35 [Gemmatimonadota bacterium]NIV23040.1 50S ribosomal protein L35 [Gemmatimonadota bacterium]NIY35072.1 50S ribosomal protein L35 [Gemmatimonadota bacterium]